MTAGRLSASLKLLLKLLASIQDHFPMKQLRVRRGIDRGIPLFLGLQPLGIDGVPFAGSDRKRMDGVNVHQKARMEGGLMRGFLLAASGIGWGATVQVTGGEERCEGDDNFLHGYL